MNMRVCDIIRLLNLVNNTHMDNKTKIFWVVVLLTFIGSIGFSYWRFVVKRDFVVFMHTECDPFVERCFVERCDPAAEGEDEWPCVGNEDEDVSFFKIQKRNASFIPLCSSDDETCDPFECTKGEKDCSVLYCDEDDENFEDGQECNDPVSYADAHADEGDDEEEEVLADDEDGNEDELVDDDSISDVSSDESTENGMEVENMSLEE